MRAGFRAVPELSPFQRRLNLTVGIFAVSVYSLVLAGICLGAFATYPARGSTSATINEDLPVSCDTVRWFAAMLTREQQEALARRYRVTQEQRRQALNCLRQEPKP